MSNFGTQDPWLFIDLIKPSKKELQSFKNDSKGLTSDTDKSSPRVFQKAIILDTFDEKEYPEKSEWMIGDSPPMVVNFFGEKHLVIQPKNLYKRLK